MAFNTPHRTQVHNLYVETTETVEFNGTAVSLRILNEGPGNIYVAFDMSDELLIEAEGYWQFAAHDIHVNEMSVRVEGSGGSPAYVTVVAGVVQ